MKAVLEFLGRHPYYIPFIIFNSYVIYRVIMEVIRGGRDDRDQGDGGGESDPPDDPILDLPPGVVLPKDQPELVEN